MKSQILLIFTLLSLIVVFPSVCPAIEGFPGSTWGELRQDLPNDEGPDGPRDLYLQGYVEQGVDWTRWGNLRFNTYGILRYKWDSEALDYNNSLGPGLGIGLLHVTPNGNYVKLGVEHIWEIFYRGANARNEEKTLLYLRWFQWWDLKK